MDAHYSTEDRRQPQWGESASQQNDRPRPPNQARPLPPNQGTYNDASSTRAQDPRPERQPQRGDQPRNNQQCSDRQPPQHSDRSREVRQRGDQGTYSMPCPKCDKTHSGTCDKAPKCPYILPNGERCNRAHMKKYCWYKDPTQVQNPRVRELIEKRLNAMRTRSQAALQTTHTALSDGDRLYEISALRTSIDGQPHDERQFSATGRQVSAPFTSLDELENDSEDPQGDDDSGDSDNMALTATR